MISNVDVYFAIAEEALAKSENLEKLGRVSKPDGQPGLIVTYDPERKSFKHSLISIAFAGMFLEAYFYIVGIERFGIEEYSKHDRKKYEEKLVLFDLAEPAILAEAEHFRKIRNELTHEKAMDTSRLDDNTIHVAQEEAKRALSFVRQVADSLAQQRKKHGRPTRSNE